MTIAIGKLTAADVGRAVIYRPPYNGASPEEGVIASWDDEAILVRRGGGARAEAIRPEHLEWRPCVGEHAWKRPPHDLVRDRTTNRRSTILYRCEVCEVHGWAPSKAPNRIRAYVGDGGLRYVPKAEATPTAVPSVEREAVRPAKHLSARDVDRRTDEPVVRARRGRADYVPQHTLDDWDRERRS